MADWGSGIRSRVNLETKPFRSAPTFEEGRAAERADVVRVLKVAAMANIDEPLVYAALKHAAGIIERGEHEGMAERGKERDQ